MTVEPAQPAAHSPVAARTVKVCANCGRPWDSHLEAARNLMKRDQPETFYLGHDGREYPLASSIRMESNVTTEACETLGWRRPKP